MKHYPNEIAHKTFERKMMGYDPADVADFLTIVAAQIEALMQERNALREALKEKELSLLEYKDRDQVLKNTITSASQMTEKMKIEADREAKLIINDAQHKAELITRDAKDSLRKVYQDIADLKKAKIFLTGGTGFFGIWLIESFLALNKYHKLKTYYYGIS